jgi:hypothetical protein
VVALTTAIGVLNGTSSEAFAVGLVFSLVVRIHPQNIPLHVPPGVMIQELHRTPLQAWAVPLK